MENASFRRARGDVDEKVKLSVNDSTLELTAVTDSGEDNSGQVLVRAESKFFGHKNTLL